MALVILRPPLVYGPGQKANMDQLMRVVDRGIPLPFATLNNRRSLIYVENLAAAVVSAVAADSTGSNTYTLADVEVSTAALIRALADALGKPARLFSLPVGALRFLARLVGRADQMDKLTNSLIVEHQSICDEMSWTPHYSFAQALVDTVAWYRTSGRQR
jgi:nucleoside-diphosphate-sugar epimerase